MLVIAQQGPIRHFDHMPDMMIGIPYPMWIQRFLPAGIPPVHAAVGGLQRLQIISDAAPGKIIARRPAGGISDGFGER
ncbi:hypothetical protein SDC9_115015 [bioreactor metagenome]|uniref:Uncharacterized protein n=1 Tax=bioreactor metagenome TaxID=1076179 RepID=A0A645C284_9ZZZZ